MRVEILQHYHILLCIAQNVWKSPVLVYNVQDVKYIYFYEMSSKWIMTLWGL